MRVASVRRSGGWHRPPRDAAHGPTVGEGRDLVPGHESGKLGVLPLELIRKDPDRVRRAADLKGEPAPIDEILKFDKEWREHLHKAEKVKEEQNKLSKEFAKTRDGKLKDRLREMADTAKEEMAKAEAVKRELDDLLLRVPNLFHESVPIGESEADNKVQREGGGKPAVDFPPPPHSHLPNAPA